MDAKRLKNVSNVLYSTYISLFLHKKTKQPEPLRLTLKRIPDHQTFYLAWNASTFIPVTADSSIDSGFTQPDRGSHLTSYTLPNHIAESSVQRGNAPPNFNVSTLPLKGLQLSCMAQLLYCTEENEECIVRQKKDVFMAKIEMTAEGRAEDEL